jgi:hypothetical protein
VRVRPPVPFAVTAALLASWLPFAPAGAAPATPASPAAAAAPPAVVAPPQVTPIPLGGDGLARISPELAGVRVDGDAAARAQAAFDLAFTQLQTAIALKAGAQAQLQLLAQREVELTALIDTTTDQRKAAALRLATARETIRELATDAFILSADHDGVTQALDIEHTTQIASARVLSSAAREAVALEVEAAQAELAAANQALDAAHQERDDTRARVADVQAAQAQAESDELRYTADAGQAEFDLSQVRAVSRVTGTDFTLVALDAFVRASNSSGSCRMPWWGLAGISRVEGRHGTYGGGHLLPNGDVSDPIIGIPLTGAAGTAVVTDTDGGALDGDPTYDRAVGPMQFIPSTWSRWYADGDGDGNADPQNIYDAVAAAAGYLCYGRVMNTTEDLRSGYFSYNHSEYYVETVLAYALNYGQFQIPAPPPPPPIPPTYPTPGQ